MHIVTTEQMRELDRRTIQEFGTKGEVLMERAGHGVADVLRRVMDYTGFVHPFVLVIAGRGNNGGDGFVVARILHEAGLQVEVWIAGNANELKGDAAKHFSLMTGAEVPFRQMQTMDDWEVAATHPFGGEIIVDSLLGTGVTGPARGPVAGAIKYINERSGEAIVVSIDVPSGLDSDTGRSQAACVRADVTVTIGLPKRGLLEPAALEYVGALDVVDIGIPREYVEEADVDRSRELIVATDVRDVLPRRPRDAHKGMFGRVLMVGGAEGMSGAMVMAARAAIRSGAGLVTVLVPERNRQIVASGVAEAMVYGADQSADGGLSIEAWQVWRRRFGEFDAILVGPGMGRCSDTMAWVREFLRGTRCPLVIDADALTVMAAQPDWLAKATSPVVITPHPGELAALFNQDISEVQANRSGMAEAAAKYTGATVVLKGAGTVVAHADRPLAINLTGNPGMATGGTGDVLAGMIAGLLGRGLKPYDAARAAVYLHGRAGDLVAWRKSQAGLCATDLIEEIPYVFRDVTLR